jgi:hypothetical protein
MFVSAAVYGASPTCLLAGDGSSDSSLVGMLLVAVMLLLIGVCSIIALKILSYLKGGEMASAWQIMTVSFVILVIAEAVRLADMLHLANLSDIIAMVIRLIGICSLMVGFSKIKRVLG